MGLELGALDGYAEGGEGVVGSNVGVVGVLVEGVSVVVVVGGAPVVEGASEEDGALGTEKDGSPPPPFGGGVEEGPFGPDDEGGWVFGEPPPPDDDTVGRLVASVPEPVWGAMEEGKESTDGSAVRGPVPVVGVLVLDDDDEGCEPLPPVGISGARDGVGVPVTTGAPVGG